MEQVADKKTEFSGKPEDFAKDIQAIAKEQGLPDPYAPVKEEVVTPIVTPAQPPAIEPQAAVTPTPPATQEPTPAPKVEPVAVPEKFKAPDGTLDVAKVKQSTESAEQTLTKYLELEKTLKRQINKVNEEKTALITNPPAPSTPVSSVPVNESFAQQVTSDLVANGIDANAAKAMTPTLIRFFSSAADLATEQARKELMPLKQELEQTTTRRQVEAIGKSDPWVYTEEGYNTLSQILTEQPYLQNAPDPYLAAYRFSGRGVIAKTGQSVSQVLTPTPTARATAPVPSAIAANPAPASPTINLNSQEAIDGYVKTLTPKQQEEFYMKLGLPAFPKTL